MAEKKEKRYVSDNAQLMAEWDWEKNDTLWLDPQKLTCGSEKKAWWKCSAGHYWFAVISSRNKGHGCPYCSGRFAVTGKNDLRTVNPILASQWNYKKTLDLLLRICCPIAIKKFGGYVAKDTNGKLPSAEEVEEVDVQLVTPKEIPPSLSMQLYTILNNTG